jgi:hypothetical protein
VNAPLSEEIARVDAWRAEQERLAAERYEGMRRRAPCGIHGRGCGRILYGPMPWGYGPGCKHCRREWSRRHGGQRWESDQQARERKQREHAEMVAEIEAMPPTEFWPAWEELRARRYEATRRYHREAQPDEFGVNHFGSATPEGKRYYAMRDRVWREMRAFEEARNVL